MHGHDYARLVAEKVLGKPLKRTQQVHHVDGDENNNRHNNLVICPTQAYHWLLHTRATALAESGDADKRKCRRCGCYDITSNMKEEIRGSASRYYHKACQKDYDRRRNAT